MREMGVLRVVLVSLAVVGFCLPQAALAANHRATNVAVDVALQNGGVLLGQVVDPQGRALAGVPVSLRYQDQDIATTKTGDEGYFAISGVPHGGVYQIAAGEGHGVFRLWTPGAAPPTVQPGALVVAGSNTTRAQYNGFSGVRNFLSNPWVIAGIIATAVAVPVAIHNAGGDEPTSP